MSVLDGVYWTTQVVLLAMAALSLVAALHLILHDWRLLQTLEQMDATEAVVPTDTYYVVHATRSLSSLITPAAFLFMGGVLHWLRRLYQTRKETH
ncbi:MAG: hypothetical protein AAFU49_17335 [Pseudomonadota bacterium]